MTKTKQYFYQFSTGEYSDYRVGGLFVCDHEVTGAEWKLAYEVYQTECERLAVLVPKRQGSWVWNNDSPEYCAYNKHREDNHPEKLFQRLHNMHAVECVELWRDYGNH